MRSRFLYISAAIAMLAAIGLVAYNHQSASRKNVILIVLDTLRADHLGIYGYERATTPNLDNFARNNILFRAALTVAPWTPPAVASIFTGRYPSSHGMIPPDDGEVARQKSSMLDPENITIAELLRDHGYQTGGVTPNPWLKEEFGYNQGFDQYIYEPRETAEHIVSQGTRLLDSFDSRRPFFLYLHFIDPHDPYDAPSAFKNKFTGQLITYSYDPAVQELVNKYDGEINYLDDNLGRLFELLKNKGVWDNSMVIIIGDHGEQFMEHGNQGHGYNMYREELRVPLMIKVGAKASSVDKIASSIDILPSIMDWVGLRAPNVCDGVSLLNESAISARRGVMSEIDRRYKDIAYIRKSFSSRSGMRLIVDYSASSSVIRAKPTENLIAFNWIKDGYGKNKILDSGITSELRTELETTLSNAMLRGSNKKSGLISAETLRQLRSLGYIGN